MTTNGWKYRQASPVWWPDSISVTFRNSPQCAWRQGKVPKDLALVSRPCHRKGLCHSLIGYAAKPLAAFRFVRCSGMEAYPVQRQ